MSALFCPKLVFLCPPDFGKFWANEGLDNLIKNDTQIHLRVDKNDYSLIPTGDRDVLADYWSGVRVEKGMQRLSVKATIKDPREKVELMMRSLSSSPNQRKTLVTCYDFHRRLDLDDMNRGFRIHVGILSVGGSGGSLSEGYVQCDGTEVVPSNRQYYTSGFSLELMEQDKVDWNMLG